MSQEQLRDALDRRDARFDEKLDKLMERLEGRFDRIEAKVDLRQDEADKEVQREFRETRRDLGDLRDLIGAQGRRIDEMDQTRNAQAEASAEGAARGAGQAAGIVAAATAKVTARELSKGFFATTLGKVVAVCVGFTAVVTAIGAIPTMARGFSIFWAFLVNTK